MRTLYLTLLLLFCLSTTARAQAPAVALADPPPSATEVPVSSPAVAREAAVSYRPAPAFPGGSAAFASFLHDHLEYPALAQDYAVEGTVVVEVEVQTDGTVNVLGIAESLFAPLDTAALRAARQLPRFLPAVEQGRAVTKLMRIPFRFSLR